MTSQTAWGEALFSRLGSSVRRRRRAELEWDAKFGVDTAGITELSTLEVIGSHAWDGVHYEPTAEKSIRLLLDGLPPLKHGEFTFWDLGCGKGKAMLMAAALPWKAVRGVEFSPALAQVAESNFRSYRGPMACRDLAVICGDAATTDIPDGPLVIYLYNPFGPTVLEQVMNNLRRKIQGSTQPVYVLYHIAKHPAAFERSGMFERLSKWRKNYVYARTPGMTSKLHIRDVPVETYDSFAHSHPQSTVFHQAIWWKTITRFFKSEPVYLGIFDGDQLVGALPVAVKRKFIFKLYGSPPPGHATPPVWPLFPEGREADVLAALEAWIKKQGISYLQMRWRGPIGSCKARAEPFPNLEVPLKETIEDNWQSVRPSTRRAIRNSVRKHQVKIHWTRKTSFLDEYARLLRVTYHERQGVDVQFPFELRRVIWENREKLNLRILVATHQNKTVAALWLLFEKDHCCWWDGASDDTAWEVSANHLLQWEAIRWCAKRRMKFYDMVGYGRTQGGRMRHGVADFKSRFGAQPANHTMLFWHTPLLRFALEGYRLQKSITESLKELLLSLRKMGK